MPSCVSRDAARYFGGVLPTLLLYSAEPVVQLPPFRMVAGRPAACEGWRFTPGVTYSLVEGPGRFVLMVEGITHPDEVDARFTWLGAVERAGGAVVAVADDGDVPDEGCAWAVLAEGGRARGGYIPVGRRS